MSLGTIYGSVAYQFNLTDIIKTQFAAVFLEILVHLKSSLKNSATLKI